jgi:hypothetical protein
MLALAHRPGDNRASAGALTDNGRFVMQRKVLLGWFCVLVGWVPWLGGWPGHAGAQVVAPGYIVGTIPLPATVQGDVAVVGTTLFVGQGSFGAGQQQVVRRTWDGSVTTLITGLNSIGGLAASHSYLFVSDNGGELLGAATGDTLFALAAPLTATGPQSAAGLEVAAPGTIPYAQAVVIGPDGEPYVGNAVGFGGGEALKHRSFFYLPFTPYLSGYDYIAGLAFDQDGKLFVGDLDSTTFEGKVFVFDPVTNTQSPLVTGLSGAYDQAFDHKGRLVVSGGFTSDYSSSTLVAIDTTTSTVTQIAEGFAFSSGIHIDPISGRIYVVDFGVQNVFTLTPIETLFGGKAPKARDCWSEFSDVTPRLNKKGQPTNEVVCQDGDPACDRDGAANGSCEFALGVCLNVPRAPICSSPGIASFELLQSQPGGGSPDPNLQQLQAFVTAALPLSNTACFGPAPVSVPLVTTPSGAKPGKRKVKVRVRDSSQRAAVDRLVFRCLP